MRVIHHGRNRGYGAAVRTGLAASSKEWICFTDGDDEYDLYDLERLWRLRRHYELIITFRYVRRYSGVRILISWIYNWVLRRLFFTRFRDISTGLRLVRREIVEELDLEATSPFIGAEIAIKTMFMGHPVGEVGIQTFPRDFRRGASTTPGNIVATIVDMIQCRRRSSPPRPSSGPGGAGHPSRDRSHGSPGLAPRPRPGLIPDVGCLTGPHRDTPAKAGRVAGTGRAGRAATPSTITRLTASISPARASASAIDTSPRPTPRSSSVSRFSGSRLQLLQTGWPEATCSNFRRATSSVSVSNTLPSGACFRQSEQHR